MSTNTESIQTAIDEGFTSIVSATLLTGYNGSAGLYADDAELEKAADIAVRLRAKVQGWMAAHA